MTRSLLQVHGQVDSGVADTGVEERFNALHDLEISGLWTCRMFILEAFGRHWGILGWVQ